MSLAVRAYVDEHQLLHWEIVDRETQQVLSRVRAAPKVPYYGGNQLSWILKDIKALTSEDLK